jgi:hypothetical protein
VLARSGSPAGFSRKPGNWPDRCAVLPDSLRRRVVVCARSGAGLEAGSSTANRRAWTQRAKLRWMKLWLFRHICGRRTPVGAKASRSPIQNVSLRARGVGGCEEDIWMITDETRMRATRERCQTR